MKKRTQPDAITLLEHFQKKVLENKPSFGEMVMEIQMMKFKIKPVQGDFSTVNFKNNKFVETLWSLGKLDEFFQKKYPQLSKKEKDTFFVYFDSIQRRLQDDLNHLNLRKIKTGEKPSLLEMEIFKEHSKKHN